MSPRLSDLHSGHVVQGSRSRDIGLSAGPALPPTAGHQTGQGGGDTQRNIHGTVTQ